jgi:hypothetical protein
MTVLKSEITGVELVKKIKEAIDANPTSFDMSSWAEQTDCGSVLCVAGWACVLNGAIPAEFEHPRIQGQFFTGLKDLEGNRIMNVDAMADELLLGEEKAQQASLSDLYLNADNSEAYEWLEDCIDNGQVVSWELTYDD